MAQQNNQLNIGDKIGFVRLANGIDESDSVNFYPIVEITERDGERAYLYAYPDGTVSRAAICHSWLSSHLYRIERINSRMICLSDRSPSEIKAALKRGFENDLEVYADWDRDHFVVVNKTKNTEYRVRLETIAGKVFAECSCPDFKYRKNFCKHQAEVLQFTLFSKTA